MSRTIFLADETCRAIREAAPRFGMVARPKSLTHMEAMLAPEGCEPVYLNDASADAFGRFMEKTGLGINDAALRLVTA